MSGCKSILHERQIAQVIPAGPSNCTNHSCMIVKLRKPFQHDRQLAQVILHNRHIAQTIPALSAKNANYSCTIWLIQVCDFKAHWNSGTLINYCVPCQLFKEKIGFYFRTNTESFTHMVLPQTPPDYSPLHHYTEFQNLLW